MERQPDVQRMQRTVQGSVRLWCNRLGKVVIMKTATFNKIERMISLKAIIFNTDLNYLSVENLRDIQEYANKVGVTLAPADLDSIYNSETDKIHEIYKMWCDDITYRFKIIKDIILMHYVLRDE